MATTVQVPHVARKIEDALALFGAFGLPTDPAIEPDGGSGVVATFTETLTAVQVAQVHMLFASPPEATQTGMAAAVSNLAANRPLAGEAAGLADGKAAAAQAKALGIPAGVCIFGAADFGTTIAQVPIVRAYFVGFTKGLGGYPSGAYGTALVVDDALKTGTVRYGWQAGASTAWPGNSHVSSYAHLYQRASKTRPAVAGSYDENVALKPNFGQWTLITPPAPTPTGGTTERKYGMLIFALGDDFRFACAVRGAVITDNVAEAKAAHVRGDKLVVLGGPAATAIGMKPGTFGNTQVIVGQTYHDSAVAAAALIS